METISKNGRYAVRLMAGQPLFTLGVVVTLALGIGANTAVFTVVDAILLRPLPYTDPGRLVRVWENDRIRETTREWASIPDYFDFKDQSRSFEDLGGYTNAVMTFTGPEDVPGRMVAYRVTHNLFPMLGARPIAGRGFLEEEDGPGGPVVILLSEGVRVRRFGRDPNLIGNTVEVDGIDVVVVSVMPEEFGFPLPRVDAWVPTRGPRDLQQGPTRLSGIRPTETRCVCRHRSGGADHDRLPTRGTVPRRQPGAGCRSGFHAGRRHG